MANDRVLDPAVSINQNFSTLPTEHDMQHMHYHDQLSDSLHKLQAMAAIFSCANLGDFNEDILQWFSMTMLDMTHLAIDAMNGLDEMNRNKI